MKKTIISFFTAAFMGASFWLGAQVQYKIEWKENLSAYQVSLVPQTTWQGTQAITASAQISIKVPTGSMEVYNLKNLVGGVNWEYNSRYNSPVESSAFDYISFGLNSLGTSAIPYVKDQEVPLFTFQNANECGGAVFLIDNSTDAFMPPNASKANIGNQITVLGAGGNAYMGNNGEGKADCGFVSFTTSGVHANTKFELFPTPAIELLQVSFDWQETAQEVDIRLYDQSGRLVKTIKKDIAQGTNLLKFDINTIKSGIYSMEMSGKGFTKSVGRFLKA